MQYVCMFVYVCMCVSNVISNPFHLIACFTAYIVISSIRCMRNDKCSGENMIFTLMKIIRNKNCIFFAEIGNLVIFFLSPFSRFFFCFIFVFYVYFLLVLPSRHVFFFCFILLALSVLLKNGNEMLTRLTSSRCEKAS